MRKSSEPHWHFCWIRVCGGKLALVLLTNGQTPNLTETFMPLPGGATAVYNSTGLAFYRHPDWLGTSRIASPPTTRAV